MKDYAIGTASANAERQGVPPAISPRRRLASSVALALAGAALLAGHDAAAETAADSTGKTVAGEPSVSDLKAQIDRLTQELEASRQREQALIEQNATAQEPPVDVGVTAAPAAAVTAAAPEKQDAEEKPEEPKNLAEVTVTSRRKEEKLQEVPIPVAVIGGEQMKRDNIVSVQDFARRVPNLGVTNTNARQTSIALRGLGKNSGNESMESSVGVMIDNVWQSWVGSTWVNFADIDHVEVLRGPQGTLQGKNSNLGLINVVSQTPTFKSGYYADAFAGNRNSLQGKFGATGTILPGLLAYRTSGYIDKRDGFVENLDIAVTDGKLQETESLGGRLQFLLTPSDTFSGRFILDRTASTQSMSVNPNMLDPATFANGAPRTISFTSRLNRDWFDVFKRSGQPVTVIGDPRKVAQDDKQKSRADSEGVSAEFNWDTLGHRFTSISAYRNALFEPHHDGDRTVADIMRIGGVTVDNEQWSQEFRISSKEPGPVDYQAGLFAMRSVADTFSQNHYGDDAGAFYASNAQYNRLNATAAGRQMMSAALREVMDTAYLNPSTDSFAGYGQINWHATDKATLTLGLRNTFEQRSNAGNHRALGGADLAALATELGATGQNLTDAQAIRDGQIKADWVAERQGFDQNSQNWLVNPSYKFTDDLMAYFSVAGGQKSGAAQFNANTGAVENVDPEDVMDYELGIKSTWLDKRLVFNLNLYQTDVKGFQSQLVLPDEERPGQFRTRLGNVEGIQLRGIELESSWDVLQGLNLFLNGSYNHAVYTDFRNAPCPPEANKPVCDQTGLTLPNAPAFTANFGFDYRVPFGFGLGDDYGLQWHAFLVDSFKSAANYNASLSASGKQPAYHVTDGGIGLGTRDGKYNLDLVGRNIFDTVYLTNSSNWSSTGASTGTFGDARYYGVHFRAKF